MESKRVYIGGLFHEATEKDLHQLFSKFGDVENVEIKKRAENNVVNFVFAYVNVKTTGLQIAQCFKRLNGTFWKGKRLKLELAKESFLSKLQRERELNGRTATPGGWPTPPAPPAPPKRKSLQDHILDNVLYNKRRENGAPAGVPGAPGKVVDFAEEAAAVEPPPTRDTGPEEEEPPPARGALRMFGGIGGAAPPSAPVAPAAAPVPPAAPAARAAGAAGGGVSSPPAAGSDFLSRLEAFSAVWGDDDGGGRAPFVPGRRPPERPAPAPAPAAAAAPAPAPAPAPAAAAPQTGSREQSAPAPAPAPAPRRSVAVTSAVDDNRKRMESLRQKQEAFQSQRRALQLALSAKSDAPKPNKRIVFDDSDDEEGDQPLSGHVTRPAGHGPSLFDEDGEEEAPGAEDFRIRPQYEGEKGQKLQALQARFGADERFTLNERFADGADEPADEEDEEDEEGVRDEHRQQMDILQSVLGTAVDTDRKGKKDTRSAAPVRFDPSLEAHAQYQLDNKKSPASRRTPAPAPAAPAPAPAPAGPPPEVGSGTFYQVAPELGDLFARGRQEGGGGFSLLQMMGRAAEEDEDDGEKGEYKTSKIKTKTKHAPVDGAAANPFQYDSSSSEDEAEGGATVAPLGIAAGGWNQTRKFFLQPDDARLSEGLEWVRSAPSSEELRQRAEQQRPELLELFRTMKHSRQRVLRRGRGRGRRLHGR